MFSASLYLSEIPWLFRQISWLSRFFKPPAETKNKWKRGSKERSCKGKGHQNPRHGQMPRLSSRAKGTKRGEMMSGSACFLALGRPTRTRRRLKLARKHSKIAEALFTSGPRQPHQSGSKPVPHSYVHRDVSRFQALPKVVFWEIAAPPMNKYYALSLNSRFERPIAAGFRALTFAWDDCLEDSAIRKWRYGILLLLLSIWGYECKDLTWGDVTSFTSWKWELETLFFGSDEVKFDH